jgi:hypothetical protein
MIGVGRENGTKAITEHGFSYFCSLEFRRDELVSRWRDRPWEVSVATTPDYYEVLQVSPNADTEIIEAAYRRLALKWHPDRNPGDPVAAERMRLLNDSHAILSDPRMALTFCDLV